MRSNSGTMRSILEGHPPVVAISRSCPVETLRQYNLAQRRRERRGAKKMLARSVIVQSYLGADAIVTVIEGKIIPPRHGEGDHAKHGGGAPAGCRNLAVILGRNAAPI